MCLALLCGGDVPRTLAQNAATPYPLLMGRADVEALVTGVDQRLPFIPGELLIKFRQGSSVAAQSRALTAVGLAAALTASTDSIRAAGDVVVVQTAIGANPLTLARELSRRPEVEWAQPNYWRLLHARPNDPSFERQWNFEMLDMPRSWDLNPGATSTITVAIIDSGLTANTETLVVSLWTGSTFEDVAVPVAVSPDFTASRLLPGRDFVFWEGPVVDFDGHGTHVAGTALQDTNNGVGLAGIAYQARVLPLKACLGYWEIQILQATFGIPGFSDPAVVGGCPDSAVAEAIRYAVDQGAQIINLSLGAPGEAPIIRDALQYAAQWGVFIAMSVGNAADLGNPVEYPGAYATEFAGIVSVGSVGRGKERAFYSTTGTQLELMAPGGNVQNGIAANAIFQTGLLFSDNDPESVVRPRFDRYGDVALQGTSMAAAHVTGVAALLYSQGITNAAAIEAALGQFAEDLGPQGRDNEYGFGLINPRRSLRGFGLVR